MGKRNNSSSSEYFSDYQTPDNIIDRVRLFYGGTIDLDVATDEIAQERIKATNYYTIKDNGLLKEWNGNIWCNYPGGTSKAITLDNKIKSFSNSTIWTNKGFSEINGNINCKQIIFCLFSVEHLNINPRLLAGSSCICYLRNRIKFIRPGENKNQPQHANVLVLLTKEVNNIYKFAETFNDLGDTVTLRKVT